MLAQVSLEAVACPSGVIRCRGQLGYALSAGVVEPVGNLEGCVPVVEVRAKPLFGFCWTDAQVLGDLRPGAASLAFVDHGRDQSALRELDELECLAYPASGTGVRVVPGGEQAGGAIRNIRCVIAQDEARQRLAGESGPGGVIRGRLSHPHSLAGVLAASTDFRVGPVSA
ncbi:hypothetical protein ACFWJT_27860 [Streptomyces sp. NPDC127069]|uniref:hypothetical protein n=1 Tax=Streptomyces sp. NPDC127069 TaxID=3347128 RepID=UPI003651D2CB